MKKKKIENIRFLVPANFPKTIENLGDSISSELEGNPPLWVTRRPGTHGQEVYINNAKILIDRSNFQSKVSVGGDVKTQVSSLFAQFFFRYISQSFQGV